MRRRYDRRKLGTCSILIWSVLGVSCRHEQSVELREPPPAPTSTDSLPEAPLSGQVNGEPFALGSARYYVDRRPGYEQVNIKLLAAKTETPCAPSSSDLPSVWLRRPGAEKVEPGEARIFASKGGAWEIHYQLQRDQRWIGSGDANALLVIREVSPDLSIEGELSACFRDERGSCVAGRFSAHYCNIRIDSPVRGTKHMERPVSRGERKWLRDGGAVGATDAGELERLRELIPGLREQP